MSERQLASREQKRDDAGAGLFLAEGDLVVERSLDAGCRPVAALLDADRLPAVAARLPCPKYIGGLQVRQIITGLGLPQPVIALFHRPARPSVAELAAASRRLVVAEAVDNPANVGSIVRNAAALGWDGLVLDHTSADPLSRRSLRVAMGTIFHLPHARTNDLTGAVDAIAELGFELFAMTPRLDAIDLDQVTPPARAALLIGSERAGLSEAMIERATAVRIPMADGVDSLNAASATAIGCWALRSR